LVWLACREVRDRNPRQAQAPLPQIGSRTLCQRPPTAVPPRPLLTNDVLFRPSVLTHAAFGADVEVIREVSRNRVFTAERPILEKP
jgi:hypothetical protein